LKYIFLYISVLLTVSVTGQSSFQYDTINIKEVIISRKINDKEPAGFKKITIDSVVINNNSNKTLAEILNYNTGIIIKSYGPGGTATPSFRGTGAGHTRTTWNGININHPMVGQSDLSLIPAGLIDGIQIYFGGASMAINSGGIGGIINLETKPDWNKGTSVSINPSSGSFGNYTGLIKVKSGNSGFQTVTKAFFHSAENDFRYLNNQISADPVWERRNNSQVAQQGFVQELYLRRSASVTSARVWYQSSKRNLPSSMLIQQTTGEKQFDESIRTMINHDIFKGRTSYSLTGAFLTSTLNYNNSLASIDSDNLSKTVALKASLERHLNDYIKLKVSLDDELIIIKTNNYDTNARRNASSLTVSAERSGPGRFSAMILIRETLDNKTLLIPDFSTGLQYELTEGKTHFLKANISRNSKLPAMNDLHWMPGGNPDLKNEYAFIYEISYDMTHKLSEAIKIDYDLAVYRNEIKDMIQWHPGEFSYWTADNLQKVTATGLESSFSLIYTISNVTSKIRAGYSFTRSVNNSNNDLAGKQLIYIPENQAHTSMDISYRRFYSGLVTSITGKRYTTADNSKFLQGYILNSIFAGFKMKLKGNPADINFNIDNLFNAEYQTIAYYPLPGRAYSLKLLLQINK
jgi:outer membrane cobalamin receptor